MEFQRLGCRDGWSRRLYECIYCARGNMENHVKEQQLDLYAARTSCTRMRSNQLGLSLSAVAYEGVDALSRLGLRGTPRTRRLKIGAQVRVSVRSWVNRGKRVSSRLRSIHPPVLPPPPMR